MDGYRVYPGRGALVIYVVDSAEHPLDLSPRLGGCAATVVQLMEAHWNQDLPPWPAPGLPGGRAPFPEAGRRTWNDWPGQRIPAIEAQLNLRGVERGAGGATPWPGCLPSTRSPAPRFSARRPAYRAPCGMRAGWITWRGAGVHAGFVYLSLGQREKRARSPRLAQVEACTPAHPGAASGQGDKRPAAHASRRALLRPCRSHGCRLCGPLPRA